MTRGVTHILQVIVLAARAHTLLRRHSALIGPLLQPQKGLFELIHASIGEQQGGIVCRHQRTRVHARVAL